MQPDIEIYLLSCPTDKIISWLNERFTLLDKQTPSAVCTKLVMSYENQVIPVTIIEQAAGKRFTSILFDTDKTPWDDDISCAKEAYRTLQCEIRCNLQSWSEDDNQDPDQWWKINDYEEGPFIWK
ncbi:hypothetical protein MSP8887_00725 [Marinomonas spartinae]|uniref:Uncharacterized protein n=1 Tax=Marinomonas spartinae TaxID=1792290 RepID=A0A1A8T7P6_9GAMM|nr:hypothetical protein [Marinomonas spartinae]SBS27766.1 hypothetical protein MSP8887_00725 [Marinomonas spartinae]SBS28604.1 hypothetical protein MSP8886_01242 [Marinomonas spartinae]